MAGNFRSLVYNHVTELKNFWTYEKIAKLKTTNWKSGTVNEKSSSEKEIRTEGAS
jgi:hypothetical protein